MELFYSELMILRADLICYFCRYIQILPLSLLQICMNVYFQFCSFIAKAKNCCFVDIWRLQKLYLQEHLPYALYIAIIYNKLLELFKKWLYCTLSSIGYFPLTMTLHLHCGSWWSIYCTNSGVFFTSRRYYIIGAVRNLIVSLTYILGGTPGYHLST